MKLIRYILPLSLSFFLISNVSVAQKVLTLEECLKLAIDNNIDLQRSENNLLIAKSNKFQAMMNYLPNLSGGVNYDFTKGTFFDQFIGSQVSTTTNTSDPFLRSSMTVFNGFSNHHNLRQRINLYQAAEQDVEASKVDTKNSVLTAYLNVILDFENVKISDGRVELLEAQLEREVKRESVGVGNLETVFNFRSQLANEKLNNVQLRNTLKRDRLQLLQILRIDPATDVQIQSETVSEEELLVEIESFQEVLQQCLGYSPSMKSAASNHQAAVYSLKGARSARYPTVTAFGQIGSRYSSNGARNPETGDISPNATLRNQLDWNYYQYANLSLSIPIFSRFQNENTIQTAKINMHNAELDLEQAELTVTNTVQTIYLDLVSAQETYVAAKENLEALDQSFQFINRRYETGNTDFYTYLESLNNKNRAEIELVNAKYSIIFRKKILDLFKGV